jgi:hypothetical protein
MVKWSAALLGITWALGAPVLAQIEHARGAPAQGALQYALLLSADGTRPGAAESSEGRRTHHAWLPLGAGRLSESDRAELPLPLGINFDYFDSTETMLLSDASVSINGQPIPSGLLNLESLETVSYSRTTRADVWLLPFLNLYLVGGTFSGTARNINASVTGMQLPIPSEVPYSGTSRGFGATLAGGYRSMFFSYDRNVTWAEVDTCTGKVPSVTEGLRVGVRLTHWRWPTRLYAGGFKMTVDTDEEGSIVFAGLGQFDYKLKATPESDWNYIVGVEIDFAKRGLLTIERGFGKRSQTLVSAGCRF